MAFSGLLDIIDTTAEHSFTPQKHWYAHKDGSLRSLIWQQEYKVYVDKGG